MTSLTKNIIYNLLGQSILIIFSFIAVKFIFKRLGEDALGIIYFTIVMNVTLSAVFEMGLCATTLREVSKYFAEDFEYIKRLIRTSSLFYWGTYLLLGAMIYLLAPVLVEKWINLKTMDTKTAVYVLRILGISSLVAMPKAFYASLLNGLQRMEINNAIDVVSSAIQQLGAIFILAFGAGLFSVIFWFVFCYLLSVLAYFIVCSRFFSLRALIPGYFFEVIKRNFSFTSKMAGISFISIIHAQADKIIVSKLLPIGVLGYYGFSYTIAAKGALLNSAVSQAAFPSFSAQFSKGDYNGLFLKYRKLQDFITFAIAPIFAGIIFALLPVFSYILSPEIAKMLLLPTTLLCLGLYMGGAANIPYVFSLAVGKPGISARANFYALIVVLPVTVFLVYSFGLAGAGFSLVFYQFFSYLYFIPKVCSQCLKISIWRWYLQILKVFILIASTYGFAWVIVRATGDYSIFSLASAYIGASIFYLGFAYFMITKELKEAILKFFSKAKTEIVKIA